MTHEPGDHPDRHRPSAGRSRAWTVGVVAVASFGAGGLAVALGLPWWILLISLALVLLSAVGFT